MTTKDQRIDMKALKHAIEENPEEFRRFLEETESALHDKYGRALKVTDKVITPADETGMIIRLDRKSKRVLIKLDDGRTRMLMAHRVEVRRGRPRKKQLKVAG